MMDGWAGPTLGIFLISQLGAAVWWAGTTQERVDQNTSIIEQVVVNDKNIEKRWRLWSSSVYSTLNKRDLSKGNISPCYLRFNYGK